MRFIPLIASATLASASLLAHATPITYDLNESFLEDDSNFVHAPTEVTAIGTITTNGTIGVITQADITSFTLTVSSTAAGNTTSGTFNSGNGYVYIFGSDLTATTSGLSFNYADHADGLFALIENNQSNTLCDITAGYGECDNLVSPQEFSVNYVTYDNIGGASSYSQIATASTAATPEPSSIVLLGTGLLSAAGFVRKRLA